MASFYDLKPAFQGLLRPLVRALAARGVSANQVTVAACALSILGGAVIYRWAGTAPAVMLLLPFILFARMGMNAVDGMLAREHDMRSALGGFLNELADVVSDAALYLPLAVLPGVSPPAVVLFVLLAACSEIAGIVSAAQGASRRYDGPMGKSDRAFAIGALGLLAGLGADSGSWINWVLLALASMVLLTVVNRVRNGLKEIESR
ncbi:MAG: CDP-alcohol phosphatidyltransferase family protein [Gammaproteobacteria bacterium]